MSKQLPEHHQPDKEWAELAASLSVDELIAGNVVTAAQADFACRIVAQQIYILLISNCRPISEKN